MEIIQELGRSYLIADVNKALEREYMIRMLTDNVIDGCPVCRRGIYTDRDVIKYDITNMKSLRHEYDNKSMHYDDLKWLFYSISENLTSAAEYLLTEDSYTYDPDLMYIDMESGKLYMICIPYPCKENDGEQRYLSFADFLLEKIEHREEQAVSIAYQFYRMSKEELFSMIGFCAVVDREGSRASENGKYIYEERYDVTEQKDNIIEGFEENEVDLSGQDNKAVAPKTGSLIPVIIAGILFVGLTIFYFVYGRRSVSSLSILSLMILSGIVTVILVSKHIYEKVRYKREKELERDMSLEPVSVGTYWGGDEKTQFFTDEETQFFTQKSEREYYLEWNENGEEKREAIKGAAVVIGKKYDEVDVCISDPTVSRKHAKIMIHDKDVFIQDLGSTNGTYVEGVRIKTGENIRINGDIDCLLGKVAIRVV